MNTMRISLIFFFSILMSYTQIAISDDTQTSQLKFNKIDHDTSTEFNVTYQGIPLHLFIPSIQLMDSDSARMYIQVIPNDRTHQEEEHDKLNTVFNIDPESISLTSYHLVKSFVLEIGDFTLPIELQALRNYRGGGRGPAYVNFVFSTNNKPYISIPFTKVIREQLKKANTGFLKSNNTDNSAYHATQLDVKVITDYLNEYDQLKSKEAATAQARALQLDNEKAAILAYRKEYLPEEVQLLNLGLIDESSIPEPNHRIIDRVCYKALYPYYRALQLKRYPNSKVNHSVVEQRVIPRCINAKLAGADATGKCKRGLLPLPKEQCACAGKAIEKFWEDSNKSHRPILWTSRSQIRVTSEAIRSCR